MSFIPSTYNVMHLWQHSINLHSCFQFGDAVLMCSTCTAFSSGSILNCISSCALCVDRNGSSRSNSSYKKQMESHEKLKDLCHVKDGNIMPNREGKFMIENCDHLTFNS